MRRLIAFFTILLGIAQWSMLNAQSSTVNGQRSMDLDEVQVTAHRRLVDTGVQKTVLDTAILHQNVALSMSDILTQHSTLFIKSYGRATESTAEF